MVQCTRRSAPLYDDDDDDDVSLNVRYENHQGLIMHMFERNFIWLSELQTPTR